MERDIGNQLAEFAVRTKYEDIPKEVVEFTKYLVLKTVAGTLVGAITPSGRKMAGVIRDQKHPEEYGVYGSGFKTSMWEAILLNSYFSHASELEDDRFSGGACSWDITVIPLLLSLAEKLGISGKALMEALVLGLEVHTRTCSFSPQHLGLVVIPGAVGPAVGGAKALGLGVKETAAAIGIGMSCAPLAMMNAGTDAHFLESALMCLQGVMAAEMAKAGLRGNPDITRFLTNYLGKERVVPEKMVEDLGKRWILREIAIKKYPCCVLLHRYIDSVIELRKQHNLSLEGVKVIEVHASPGDVNCNRPDPKDENDMQFSFQHTLAAAMLRGDVGLKDMSPEAVSDSKLKEGRTKVNFVLHPELSSLYLEAPTRVVIKTNDGREFSRERQYAIGGPEEPLTAEQHRGLYYKFTQGILKEGDISRTADMILNLEKLKNVKELNEVLSTARK